MKISIITPNYNYGNYIAKTIQSIIAQKYSDIEYIIVDDGSSDNSAVVIEKALVQLSNFNATDSGLILWNHSSDIKFAVQ